MKLNEQAPENYVHRSSSPRVLIYEVFPTIQGEGPWAGTPSIFIRTAGCNIQCSHCDTIYTGPQSRYYSLDELVEHLQNDLPAYGLIVLTGGEPFRQGDTSDLIQRLLNERYRVQVETNGLLMPADRHLKPGAMWGTHKFRVVCSPKTPKLPDEMWQYISDLKYVVQEGFIDEDGLPLRSVGSQYGAPAKPHKHWSGEIYIQPLDEKDEERNKLNTEAAVASCLKHGYRLCLQQQKIVGLV